MNQAYNRDGYYFRRDAISRDEIKALLSELGVFDGKANNYGVRDLMNKVPYIKKTASLPPLIDFAKNILGNNAKPVRSVYFDKVSSANWNVAWHQDTSIAVKTQCDAPGFGPWTIKQGVVHVEPPQEYLKNILTVRVHLDTANTATGVLRVIPGTHKDGRMNCQEILKIVERSTALECNAGPGDVLLMNPLLLHSSRKASNPSHRRIIHIEYSAMELPGALEWYECA